MNVLPEYLEGNRTGSYTPEQWLDEVKDKNSDEIIQEGTPMDAEHFNHMEQGIHNNSLMLALLLENVKHTQQSVESVDGEELEVTLTNTKDFYFNNSVKTVALANMRSTLDYRVITEVQQLKLLATNGMLVKRPLVVNGDTVLIGFKEAEWAEKLN